MTVEMFGVLYRSISNVLYVKSVYYVKKFRYFCYAPVIEFDFNFTPRSGERPNKLRLFKAREI